MTVLLKGEFLTPCHNILPKECLFGKQQYFKCMFGYTAGTPKIDFIFVKHDFSNKLGVWLLWVKINFTFKPRFD